MAIGRIVNGEHWAPWWSHSSVPFNAIKTTDSMVYAYLPLFMLYYYYSPNKVYVITRHDQQTQRTHTELEEKNADVLVHAKKNKGAAPLVGNIFLLD